MAGEQGAEVVMSDEPRRAGGPRARPGPRLGVDLPRPRSGAWSRASWRVLGLIYLLEPSHAFFRADTPRRP